MTEHVHPRDKDRESKHQVVYTRRRFLQRSSLAVAGGVLFSCTGGRVIPKIENRTPSVDTATPIKRVVYVMLENRSFNNVFGRFGRGVEATSVGVELGAEKPLIRCPEWLPSYIPHDRAAHLNSVNGGKMDGFGNNATGFNYAYSVFDEDQIPNYYTWAREYGLSDHFFASVGGPSYPNHFYFIAGQAGGVLDNPENIETRVTDGKPFKSWGCDAVGDDVFVFVKDDNGNLTKHDTCFDYGTVGEQLSDIGVDWAYYSAVPGQSGYFWNAYNGIGNVIHSDLWPQHMRPVDRIVADIEAERLPAVTWITPRFELSDHPPESSGHAHNWLSDIVNAIMRSSMWEHTAIFITWDEWGGFYDPVVPPQVDDAGLGVRVPLLTISPYTERGVIDTEVGEFSTPLRFISDNWGLDYLTPRIAKTHSFEHVFNFRKGPRDPVFGRKQAPTFGTPWEFPEGFDGWKPGTVPRKDHFV
ncbi:MAG: alkaline phosphatase family protein, partial [Actinomycetota bacterium]